MNVLVLLMVLSVVGVAALFIALAAFLFPLVEVLENVGGPRTRFHQPVNYLGKIRLGLRAIETETAGIAPQAERLNGALAGVHDALKRIDRELGSTLEAVQSQEER